VPCRFRRFQNPDRANAVALCQSWRCWRAMRERIFEAAPWMDPRQTKSARVITSGDCAVAAPHSSAPLGCRQPAGADCGQGVRFRVGCCRSAADPSNLLGDERAVHNTHSRSVHRLPVEGSAIAYGARTLVPGAPHLAQEDTHSDPKEARLPARRALRAGNRRQVRGLICQRFIVISR